MPTSDELAAITSGLRDWRAAHPSATFAEIEAAVEERLDTLRARWLSEAAQDHPFTTLAQLPADQRPRCPACDLPLVARGQQERTLLAPGEQPVRLRRSYASCPRCGSGLFPPR